MNREAAIEALATHAHEAWSGWMRYMFKKGRQNLDGSFTIPADLVNRWKRQITTPYRDLPASEQISDQAEAQTMLGIVEGNAFAAHDLLAACKGFVAAIDRWSESLEPCPLCGSYEHVDDCAYVVARAAIAEVEGVHSGPRD